MIILVDSEKSFDKTQHPFIIKTLKKTSIGKSYLNMIKPIYDKPTCIIINGGH